MAFTGLQSRDHPLTTVVLLRFGRWRWGLLDPFPDMAFFHETFDSFSTDALACLLLHRLHDFPDVFGGGVEILIHLLLLFSMKDGRTSVPGTIL